MGFAEQTSSATGKKRLPLAWNMVSPSAFRLPSARRIDALWEKPPPAANGRQDECRKKARGDFPSRLAAVKPSLLNSAAGRVKGFPKPAWESASSQEAPGRRWLLPGNP
ncbi:hypothetical protein [Frankia sp. CcI49]|uniref:hypothetical protein n=1 Tax=Frankia sp. CcI49 TaxID=1745382 RepID=UPI0013046540|nr:hypothetical protein [Frankia sp. CcI49]